MIFSKLKLLKKLKVLNQIKKNLEAIILILIDSFILIPPVFDENKYDICVVKVDALGDFILSLDSLYNIFLKYKGKRTILICNKMIYELANS